MSVTASKPPAASSAGRRVTINDLAGALGVTKSTVSRALNGYPDISPTTRARIQRQAEVMGYRPLSHAQAIRTGRTRSLGLALQTDEPGALRAFLSDFLAGLTRQASAESWTLTVATAETEDGLLDTLARLVDEQKADGFILPRTLSFDPRVVFLRERNVPFVLFGRTQDDAACPWFDILGEDAMRDAVLRLAEHGHRRIAFVNGGMRYHFGRLRQDGFAQGLSLAGIEEDPDLLVHNAMSASQGAQATQQLLALDRPPTAIVFATDIAAMGAYAVAADLGLTVGQDLSVIGYDGLPEGQFAVPRLTTFSVDSRRAGERLASLLIRRIRGAAPETLREVHEARLQIGRSDGPPRHTSETLAHYLRQRSATHSIPKGSQGGTR